MAYTYQQRLWETSSRSCCVAENGMVAAKHPLISKTGIDIMRMGGNAVDAAVAAAFVDCVVEPAMNGIGGEGVMAIHLVEEGKNIILDYVGRPSQNCTPDMYALLDEIESGGWGWRRVKDDANVIGYKASTTPGMVAGLVKAVELYGTMDLKDILDPAIKIAEEGFIVGWWTASHILLALQKGMRFPEWRKIFLKEDKYIPKPYTHSDILSAPDRLVNKDLANSLRLIAKEGADAFYVGDIAKAIAKDMAENNGLITAEDLAMYEPLILDPIPGTYRGFEVIYDPSHAGTTLMEILNILEGFNLTEYGFGSLKHLHVLAEAIGLAFADRFQYMGDPGFIKVPQKGLVSKEYAKSLTTRINFTHALEMRPGNPGPYSECTTALTVVDKNNNAVAINQTLVNHFGSGVVIPGTGIVLNNAMYGLNPEPGHANSISGRKRRIQNVCPTILLKDGTPFLVTAAPGGRAIHPAIAQVIVNVVDFEMDIQSAIEAPRVARETQELLLDSRFSLQTCDKLKEMGHQLYHVEKAIGNWARPVGIVIDPENNLRYGGVECYFLGFGSEAIGY